MYHVTKIGLQKNDHIQRDLEVVCIWSKMNMKVCIAR
jgi:hypothetical protein